MRCGRSLATSSYTVFNQYSAVCAVQSPYSYGRDWGKFHTGAGGMVWYGIDVKSVVNAMRCVCIGVYGKHGSVQRQ